MAYADQAVNDIIFKRKRNSRKIEELYLQGKHISIEDLKKTDCLRREQIFQYLSKDIPEIPTKYFIPAYPTPVEFHITEVAHVTNKTRLPRIWESKGFKGLDEKSFSWWSLKINEENIREAEERYLEKEFPDRTSEQRASQQNFLHLFTTSPSFLNDRSRFGNFRFTFPVTELMDTYRKQICNGEDPILRVFETIIYKQEIVYVVLVHSPEMNQKFQDFPELKSSSFITYDEGKIIWKAQAICETHTFELVKDHETKMATTEMAYSEEFYVWDHVSLAFHIDTVLDFPKRRLKESITCCEIDEDIKLSNGEICSLEEAEKICEALEEDDKEEKYEPGDENEMKHMF
ncbi:uncharacterized protein LOC127643895 [Xyrauchen texanus]|uniref:uncharacterized protein LOC127643895 n=1 Tax=Xyrauchen texanus TaxID=154827 RepID=UPI002241A06A|nr:uncharacterized protein LOC127643895 [Xyrauchen texanus]